MKCPACKNDAIVIEYRDIELDFCGDCRGVWFDSGELELLLGAAGQEDAEHFLSGILHSDTASTSEKARRCPICGHKMLKKHIGRKSPVLIDICEYGDGLWFDGGELNHLLHHNPGATASADKSVIDYLSDLFKAEE